MVPGSTLRRIRCRAALTAVVLAAGTAASAQPTSDASPRPTLDPSAPLAPMPDLGVAWPELPDERAPAAKEARDQGRSQQYDVVLTGLEGADGAAVRVRFNDASALIKGRGDPANAAQVDLRAREDSQLLGDILRAEGFYDAEVAPRVERPAADARPRVVLAARLGERYHFASVAVTGIGSDEALRAAFPIKPGDAVDADRVTKAEAGLRSALGRQGYAFASVGVADVAVDHATRTATLAIAVQAAGEKKRFGRIAVTGQRLFSARHVQDIARFRPGDRYDAALVDDLRRALIQTSLVSVVTVSPVRGPRPDVVDIVVHLERAPPRTVAAQLGYGTGEGVRGELSWQHRNLIRPEGAVTFRGVLGTQEQSVGAELRRGNFHARDRVLTAQLSASHSDRQAYDAKTLTLGVGIERQTNIIWQKKWVWSAGVQFLATDERDVVLSTGLPRRRTYVIATLPLTLAYDGSDDLLNPTRGFRLAGSLSPEESLRRGAFTYARLQLDASGYLPVASDRVVLAGRIRLGSIPGASRDRIAPSRRFYSGGGGSVRGYGYQDIGPRDVDNDPVGGRGLAEFALEARVRFGNFGVVPFFDGGNLSRGATPTLTGLRYGTGLGVRYYSAFGPIRVDLGTPLNRRKGDSRVAVYVSLGQAF